MSRFPAAGASAARALALAAAAAVVALVAAGCGNSRAHSAATPTASTPVCKLDGAQRRTVALARADIRGLRRIEARLQRFSQRGAPNQERLTGKFLLDLGSS